MARLGRQRACARMSIVLCCALCALSKSAGATPAETMVRSAPSPDGRRLILVYGDKRVDLQNAGMTASPKAEVAAAVPQEAPRYREATPRTVEDEQIHLSPASQVGRDGPGMVPPMSEPPNEAGHDDWEFTETVGERERRLLNALRPNECEQDRSKQELNVAEQSEQDPLLIAQPQALEPAIAPSQEKATKVRLPSVVESEQPAPTPVPSTEPVTVAPSQQDSSEWIDQRLTIVVIVLLAIVLCLLVIVIQLLHAMGRFSRSLVPTLGIEAVRVTSIAAEPASQAGDSSDNLLSFGKQRAGVAVDLAEATLPSDILLGDFEQTRKAEAEKRQRQEQAILQEIFEDNVNLRQRIRAHAA